MDEKCRGPFTRTGVCAQHGLASCRRKRWPDWIPEVFNPTEPKPVTRVVEVDGTVRAVR